MSYEYYLQACEDQAPQLISTDNILAVFAPYTVRKAPTFIDLAFDEMNHCTIYLDTNETATDGMMISRPCGTEAFVRCIYEVMLLGFFVFFEPDGHQPITLLAETEGHLMEGMVESLGSPAVASSWEEFYALWQHNPG